ncbi:hypothetical protein GCM10007063_26460 [Lentibacillus kapialis]|uniref:Uncharacterized protein n=1 Tax=Lentibacillus kapialis TaxID=340214 RepID=A0A917Q0P8_9BACI|nr:hypothetical protein [Lentibacillus kapialis]GGK02918.1 hypothetical protein GCM10007063_26460 [Lentibacillus kapialis]
MYLFMEEYAFIFIGAIITIGLTIMLRAFWVMLLEIALIHLPLLFQDSEIIVSVLLIGQIALSVVVLYKYLMAIEMNYSLVLEKIHKKDPDLIKTEHRGSQFSFWKTRK